MYTILKISYTYLSLSHFNNTQNFQNKILFDYKQYKLAKL